MSSITYRMSAELTIAIQEDFEEKQLPERQAKIDAARRNILNQSRQRCTHKCADRHMCGHKCCKRGLDWSGVEEERRAWLGSKAAILHRVFGVSLPEGPDSLDDFPSCWDRDEPEYAWLNIEDYIDAIEAEEYERHEATRDKEDWEESEEDPHAWADEEGRSDAEDDDEGEDDDDEEVGYLLARIRSLDLKTEELMEKKKQIWNRVEQMRARRHSPNKKRRRG